MLSTIKRILGIAVLGCGIAGGTQMGTMTHLPLAASAYADPSQIQITYSRLGPTGNSIPYIIHVTNPTSEDIYGVLLRLYGTTGLQGGNQRYIPVLPAGGTVDWTNYLTSGGQQGAQIQVIVGQNDQPVVQQYLY